MIMFNFSIRKKLILTASVVLFLILACGLYLFATVSPILKEWDDYQQQAATRQVLLLNIKSHFGYGAMIHNFKNYVLRGQDKYLDRISKNYKDISRDVAQYNQLEGLTNDEREALKSIARVAKLYYDHSLMIKDMFAQQKSVFRIDSAVKIDNKPAFVAFDVLNSQYHSMTDKYGEAIKQGIMRAKFTLVFGLVGISVVIAGLLTILYFSIIPSLLLLNKTMTEISRGEGDLSVRLEESKKDELGQLAISFNIFVSKLESIISEEKNIIKNIFNHSEELKAVIITSNQSIENQVANTEQLASAINEMTSSVEDVANSAVNASSATEQINVTANDGQQAVNNTMGQIQAINSHLEQASDVINEVNQASDNIGQVLNVISAIAEQTNLLALNAAIEAARAGESGRGFAVVADEVRGLAQRTASSLGDIKAIIEQLQSGARTAVDSMKQGVDEVTEGSTIAQQASENITLIVSDMKAVGDMNRQIVSATKEQSSVAEEMSRNVHEISDMSSSILGSSQHISERSTELALMTARLKELAESFKTRA